MTGDLSHLLGYAGGWLMPIVCGGRSGAPHPLELLAHAYEDERGRVMYTAPHSTVRQTRQSEAEGVPGWSRESVRFVCPVCPARPLVDRRRWAAILDEERHAGVSCVPNRPPLVWPCPFGRTVLIWCGCF